MCQMTFPCSGKKNSRKKSLSSENNLPWTNNRKEWKIEDKINYMLNVWQIS